MIPEEIQSGKWGGVVFEDRVIERAAHCQMWDSGTKFIGRKATPKRHFSEKIGKTITITKKIFIQSLHRRHHLTYFNGTERWFYGFAALDVWSEVHVGMTSLNFTLFV